MTRCNNVLVVGAAGTYGYLAVVALAERGVRVRGMIHRPETADIAIESGASETIVADLNDPASLERAVEGVDGVFYICPEFQPNEAQMGINIINAAKAAGVRKFVYSSVQHPYLTPLVNHVGKLPVHEALTESRMTFIILMPTTFMQSIEVFQWAHVLEKGVYRHPIRRTALQSWVDYRDVAEAAAIGLTGDMLDYGSFEMAAGGMISNEDLAKLMSEALGREIGVEDPDFETYIQPYPIDDPYLKKGYKAIMDWYSEYGFPGGNNLSLRTILGREPRTLKAYVEELAAKSRAG